jgi:hypothetical protein
MGTVRPQSDQYQSVPVTTRVILDERRFGEMEG